MTQPPDKTLELIERIREPRNINDYLRNRTPAAVLVLLQELNDERRAIADLLASHHAAANELGYEDFDAMIVEMHEALEWALSVAAGVVKMGNPHYNHACETFCKIEAHPAIDAITNRSAT